MDGAASQIGSTPAEAQGALRSLNPATSRPDQGTFGPVPGQLIGVTLILNGDECTQCDRRETEYSPSATWNSGSSWVAATPVAMRASAVRFQARKVRSLPIGERSLIEDGSAVRRIGSSAE